MTRYSNSLPTHLRAGEKSIQSPSAGADVIFSAPLSTKQVEQAVYNAAENDLFLLDLFKQSVPFSPLAGDRAQAILTHHFRRASVDEMNLLLSCTDVQTIREWVSDYIDFIIMRDTLLIAEDDEFLQEEQPRSPVEHVLEDLLKDFRKLERIAQIVDEILLSFQQSSLNTPLHLDRGRTPLEIRQDALRNSEKFSAFQDSYRFDATQNVFAQREGPVPSYPIFGADHPQGMDSWRSLIEKYNSEEFNEFIRNPEKLSDTEKQIVSQMTRRSLLESTKVFLANYKSDPSADVFSEPKTANLFSSMIWFKTFSDKGIIDPEDSRHLIIELKRLVLPLLSQDAAPTESTARKGNASLRAAASRRLKRGESEISTQGPDSILMGTFENVLQLHNTFKDAQILQLSEICRKQGTISTIVSGGNHSDLGVIHEAFKIFTNSLSGVSENVDRLTELLDSALIDKRVVNVQLAALAERATAELAREFLRCEFDNPSEIAWQASTLCRLVRERIPEEDVRELECLVDAIFLGESTVPDESKWWSSHKSRGLLFINAWKDSLDSPNTLDIRRAVILTTIARESGAKLIDDLNSSIKFTGDVINQEAFTNEIRQRILRALSGLPLQKACDFIKSFADCFPGILEPASIDPLALYSAIACNPFARSAILGPLESNEFTTFLELLNYIKTHSSISAPKNLALNLLCALFSSPGFSEEKLPQIHSLLGTTGSVEEIFSQYEGMKNYYVTSSGTYRMPLPITSSELKDAVDRERVILCTNVMPMHGTSPHPYQGIFVFSDKIAKQMFAAELINSSRSSYSSESNATPEHSLELSLTSPYTETITEDIVPNGTQRIALSDDLWGLILEVTGWCKERLLYYARRGRSDTNWRD